MRVNVQGGTNAGWRQPLGPKPTKPWTCECGRVNQPFVIRCLNMGCNRERP